MQWLVVALAVGALQAAFYWRDSAKEEVDPSVGWWTAAAFILGCASAVVGILISN